MAKKVDYIKTYHSVPKREIFEMLVFMIMQQKGLKIRLEAYPYILEWYKKIKQTKSGQ